MKTQRADTEVRAPVRRVLDPAHAVSWMQAQRGRIRRFVRPFTLLLAPGDGVRLMDNHRTGTEVRVAAVPSLASRVAPSVHWPRPCNRGWPPTSAWIAPTPAIVREGSVVRVLVISN